MKAARVLSAARMKLGSVVSILHANPQDLPAPKAAALAACYTMCLLQRQSALRHTFTCRLWSREAMRMLNWSVG